MLRVSGIIAFITSALIAVVLFLQVRSVDLSGTVAKFGEYPLIVELHAKPGSSLPKSSDFFWFAAAVSSTDDRHVQYLMFDDVVEEARIIPEGEVVEVSQRQVVVRRLIWTFQGLRIISGGRTYPCGTSIPVFYATLGLCAVAPLLLWSIAGLISILTRRSGGPS